MLRAADAIVACTLSTLGRNLQDVPRDVEALEAQAVNLESVEGKIDKSVAHERVGFCQVRA